MSKIYRITCFIFILSIVGGCSTSTKYKANLRVDLNREMPKTSIRVGILPFSDERPLSEREKGTIKTRNTVIPLWFLLYDNRVKESEYHFTPEILDKSLSEWLTLNTYNALSNNSIFSSNAVVQLSMEDTLYSTKDLCERYDLDILLKGSIRHFDSYSRYASHDLWLWTSTANTNVILPGEAKLRIEIELITAENIPIWKRTLMGNATNDISYFSRLSTTYSSYGYGYTTSYTHTEVVDKTTYKSAYDGTVHGATIAIEQYLNALLKNLEKVIEIQSISGN